ncbi:MAG: hypothetical protein ACKOWJ_04650 [Micrococcales bacterium]
MILSWFMRLMRRVPNPTSLLGDVWAWLLTTAFVILGFVLLMAVVFPLLDTALSPSPQL